MLRFTPGPWKRTKIKAIQSIYCMITANTIHVAHVWNDLAQLEKEAEGNAKLMAAAPKLYEACKLRMSKEDLEKLLDDV